MTTRHRLRAALAVVTLGLAGAGVSAPSHAATTYSPVNNDCSGGYVAFTFDDGPDNNTQYVMDTLNGLNLKATFFVTGEKVATSAGTALVQSEAAAGFSVQNHTWDHKSWTGASTGAGPLTEDQIISELDRTTSAIVAAGLPAPTLYRPPYGDIDAGKDLIARQDGYRIVMPWGIPTGNVVDSRDWTGISPAQIASNVVNGYSNNGYFYPGIKADSIIAMHDGQGQVSLNAADSLQAIVDAMNVKHLCSTANIRQDATGGYVPAPAPTPPANNMVTNADLEKVRAGGPAAEPVCFQQGGASVASHVASWSLTSDAHSGNVAERVDVSNWAAGDRKLVLTQRGSEKNACLAAVTPGQNLGFWVWYKGTWGSSTKVSIATYYQNASGVWTYWQASPLYPSTSKWNLAYFKSAAIPAGATAVSYGMAISGNGSLTTDDYTMAVVN